MMQSISVKQITPSPTNPRKFFDEALLVELAESIKSKGVLEPILVRQSSPANGKAARYEIVAGERRWRAAVKAGIDEVPSIIRELNDDEVLDIQIHENLHRADVHPVDEAFGYQHLLKVVAGLTVEELARRVGKSPKYVAQRLSLTTLIEPAVKDFAEGLITLGHATQISRLSPEVQPAALDACYPHENVINKTTREWERVPLKETGAHTVADLSVWINRNLNLDLKKAPWSLEDATLVPAQGACSTCPANTATNQLLFGDAAQSALCTNPEGYERKMLAWQQKQIAKMTLEDKPPFLLTEIYNITKDDVRRYKLPSDALDKHGYELIEKKKDRCGYARGAVFIQGSRRGQTAWVCAEKTCKDHKGHYNGSSSHSSSHSSSKETPEGRGVRKQELFDVRVNEPVRKRVFKEALPLITWPLSRESFNRVAFEFFKRIPSHDQQTICEAFGWDENLRWASDNKLADAFRDMDNDDLGRFLILCSVAHLGANQYMSNRQIQSGVVKFADEWGIDYALFDAEERERQAPKKFHTDHRRYLLEIQQGKAKPRMPTVDPTKHVAPDAAWISELEKASTLPAAEKELESMGLLEKKGKETSKAPVKTAKKNVRRPKATTTKRRKQS